jgi:ribonuclease Z
MVAYMGDTGVSNYSDLPHVRDAKALLIECTFFDEEHRSRAKQGRHIHVDDMAELLEGMNNEKIIITHVTRRTNLGFARKALRRVLPADVHDRVTFLMNREHMEEQERE